MQNNKLYFLMTTVRYWASALTIPCLMLCMAFTYLFAKPEAPKLVEVPVVLVESDGKRTLLWHGEDHANVREMILRNSQEIVSSIYANPKNVGTISAKVQSASKNFDKDSQAYSSFIALGNTALATGGTSETTWAQESQDITYLKDPGAWVVRIKGAYVQTEKTQSGKKVLIQLVFRSAYGQKRNENGVPVLCYKLEVSDVL